MSLYRCELGRYGIVSTMPWWYKILVNLPVINRLYTVKLHVNATSCAQNGCPLHGIVGRFRLFWFLGIRTKKFRGKFCHYEPMTHVTLSYCVDNARIYSQQVRGSFKCGSVSPGRFREFTIYLTKGTKR